MKFLINNLKLLFRKYKTATIINIAGMTAGFTVFIIVALQVKYDLTYDRNYNTDQEIYMLSRYWGLSEGHIWSQDQQTLKAISEQFAEVRDHCLTWTTRYQPYRLINNERVVYNKPVTITSPGILNVFNPEIVAGDTRGIFVDPGLAMISEKTAAEIFGDIDPIGQTIYSTSKELPLTISCVYKDFPSNSRLKNGLYIFMPETPPTNYFYDAFLSLDRRNVNTLIDKLNSNEFLNQDVNHFFPPPPDGELHYNITPLKDIYLFTANSDGNKQINTTLTFILIGVLVLLIVFINYINFSLAQAPAKAKGVNVHKIFGIRQFSLKAGIACESVMLSLISFCCASFLAVKFINTPLLQNFFPADIDLSANTGFIVAIGLLILILASLIGFYSAKFCSSYSETMVYNGSYSLSPKGKRLRNSLVIFQFATAITIMTVAAFVKIQHDFVQNYSWGFDTENIIFLRKSVMEKSQETFIQELKKDPRISDVTRSQGTPGSIGMRWGRGLGNKYLNSFQVWMVDKNFLDFFGIKILSGENFFSEGSSKFIFNEETVTTYELDESDLYKQIDADRDEGQVVGFAENINFESLREPIKPMAFFYDPSTEQYWYFYIKLSGSDTQGAINYITDVWSDFSGETIEIEFLDQNMKALYQHESNLGKLVGILGLITVIITVMGVYGLIVFNTRYKIREIGIRKIHGASVSQIIAMLNKNLLTHFILAFIIAIPIAYYIIHRWLENFAYKANIPWWLFISTSILTLLVASIAVSWPSLKAANTNPAEVLKTE